MNERKKAVFLDRDGTIIIDKNYLSDPEQIEFLPGAVEALKAFQESEYLLIVITNQSGIARGCFSMEDALAVDKRFKELLLRHGVTINGVYMCPHLKQGSIEPYNVECECRKPGLQLFKQAIDDFGLEPALCAACGDKPRDIQRLSELGLKKGRLGLLTPGGGQGCFDSLLDFAGYILK